MKILYQIIIFTLLVTGSVQLNAQQKKVIRGRVFEKGSTTTIVGATIIEYDNDERVIGGSITDINGDFVLQINDPKNTVKVSFIGYETIKVNTKNDQTLKIELAPSTLAIDEVMVTAKSKMSNGLTNIDERDNASSSVKIDFAQMKDASLTSAVDALQGKVTGLDILSSSGDPGSSSQLVIRGLSSMGNSRPLIVIDGIPQMKISNNFDLSSADSEDISNLINIALQDIKSIEVLKDAASTAVYGSQGADGVLLIETLRGTMGDVKFDYQYKISMNFQPPSIEMLNGDEYIMLQLEEMHNAYGVFNLPQKIAYDTDYKDFYNYSANTNWIDEITQTGFKHDHYFKVSGGGQRTRYFTSFSYIDEEGTTRNTGAKNFSTRVNLDYFLSKKILFSVNFNYTNQSVDGTYKLNGVNARSMAYIKAPNMSVWEYDSHGNHTGEYFTPINTYQGDGVSYFNPVAVVDLGKDNRIENIISNSFTMRYRIADWITFRESFSFQYNGSKQNTFLPYNAIGADWLNSNVNKAQETNSINSSFRTETQLAFTIPIENPNHEFTGTINWITRQNSSQGMVVSATKSPSSIITDPSIDPLISYTSSGFSESRALGAVANLNYKYRDRYILQTNYRADAFSAFGTNNRWGNFYGLSAAWRFSEELLFKGIDWLGESKLRASWGITGREPTKTYARFATYQTTQQGTYINNPSIIPTQIELSNLKWETVSSIDIGLEMNMLQDRIFFEADLYTKVTKDILFENYKIPNSTGFDNLTYLNGGEMVNYGFELMFDYNIIKQKDLIWSINVNTSKNINSFTKLPDNFNTERDISINNGEFPKRIIAGEPIGSFFGFRYLGVYPTNSDVVAKNEKGQVMTDVNGTPIPLTFAGKYTFQGGDAKYEDVNHDGVIDLNDVVYIGDSNPDYLGGFGTTVSYKNFNISTSFHYRLGFDIVNRVAINTQNMSDRNNQSKAVLYRWRVDDQNDKGMLPRAYMNHPANYLGSDRFIEAGDFIRMNDIKIGYRFNKSFCDRMGIRNANLAISGRKLFTFTNYSGQDPEVGQDASDPFWIGEDRANTPPPRMLTLSLSVGF